MANKKKPKSNRPINQKPGMQKESKVVQLEQSPIHLLHRAGQCAGDVFQSEMRTEDLTPRQYAVLVAVAENEGLSQTNLVDMTGIDRSTLADIIRRMLKKGLVQRRRTKEDARAYAVKLTEEGRRILEAAEPMAKKVDERILQALPAAERERFLSDLNMIVDALGKLEAASAGAVQVKSSVRRKG
ncbi:MAG: MarR family transcriptional regulator [Alphaproteobacteria bacterium]|nr:MarR family transcriptional regulator [Alphaproteobacteria bacterium]